MFLYSLFRSAASPSRDWSPGASRDQLLSNHASHVNIK